MSRSYKKTVSDWKLHLRDYNEMANQNRNDNDDGDWINYDGYEY